MKQTWTAEEDAKLRALAEQGRTSAEAAELMGKTKNQIIGRGHRIGVIFSGGRRGHRQGSNHPWQRKF